MDEALLRRCINKEKEAWEIFLERYRRLIYWAIRKRLKMSSFEFSEDDVSNIFQEVFLSLFEGNKLSQLKNPKLICGWLAMVTSNKTVDFMREKIDAACHLNTDTVLLKDTSSEQNLFGRELIDIIKNLIAALSDKEKIIISLNLLEEKTHKEIAHILAMPINTVSTIIARTKEKLKKKLEQRGITGWPI